MIIILLTDRAGHVNFLYLQGTVNAKPGNNKNDLTVASRDAGIDQRKSLGAVQFQQHGVSSPAGPTFKTANIKRKWPLYSQITEGKKQRKLMFFRLSDSKDGFHILFSQVLELCRNSIQSYFPHITARDFSFIVLLKNKMLHIFSSMWILT